MYLGCSDMKAQTISPVDAAHSVYRLFYLFFFCFGVCKLLTSGIFPLSIRFNKIAFIVFTMSNKYYCSGR